LSTDKITNSGVVDVTGIEAGASWQYSTDNGAHWPNGASLTLTGDGAKSVIVHQTDAAGNTSGNSAAFAFTLDTTRACNDYRRRTSGRGCKERSHHHDQRHVGSGKYGDTSGRQYDRRHHSKGGRDVEYFDFESVRYKAFVLGECRGPCWQ
jgi:hypothetical protein